MLWSVTSRSCLQYAIGHYNSVNRLILPIQDRVLLSTQFSFHKPCHKQDEDNPDEHITCFTYDCKVDIPLHRQTVEDPENSEKCL